MTLTAIVAATSTGTIGLDGDMPWQLSHDLRRFKRLTMGCIIVMGRKTFDSIGRPLPGRETFVLTRDRQWSHPGVAVFPDPESVLAAIGERTAFVVGGAQIYAAMLPVCTRVFLTRVWSQTVGDTTIDFDLNGWHCSYVERVPPAARDSVPSEFSVWERPISRRS
ncbi:Dihydrofolate reductase type 3 [Rosistilla carotiformis]|uniref:Dihydrofolate reductase n=1 Tax=Rosistilla carotiformis TaxID=2528017 RepID=A0A518JYG4_9BACT|nr:dihydrofolate reductase [Rosistilla carotiformis]QDV70579.1 Dihydrofolate reductase type 3 [Rosistilla carotiformis]